ncbi:hypothetical protein [Albirhodobacter sp. R86504]|uniref:hypothetical protein n=1 Tax=Albirhodobacter sp. R86504 TaxID=3093848 RepID=UPI00366E60B0
MWRAGMTALALWAARLGGALAHALPGSLLRVEHFGDALHITASFPLQDLVIVAPELAAMADLPTDAPLPSDMVAQLQRYLDQHITLAAGGSDLPLTLTQARLHPVQDDHLGYFIEVISDWSAPHPQTSSEAAILTYDAVMHEVRNHRATVEWVSSRGTTQNLAEYGFFSANTGIKLAPKSD